MGVKHTARTVNWWKVLDSVCFGNLFCVLHIVIKPSSYWIFKVYKIHVYLVRGSSLGRNVHRRNFFELFIIYIKLLKYLSVLKYLICTKYMYILTFQLGLVHQRKIFELFTIYIKISWSPWILCFLCNWQDYKIILQSYIFCNT